MIPYFQRLGRRVERAWQAVSYDEEIFPQQVIEALEEQPPHEHVKVEDIVEWIFSPHQAFLQPSKDKIFSQPQVMLFQGPRFYIEALFWRTATTIVHDHGFSGGFAVLAGSSVHSHWRFTPDRLVNSRMRCGRLERISTEILRPGGMRPIRSGDRLIHQLFHLEIPSVTIVVRTYVDQHHLPQYNYMPPGLTIAFEDRDSIRARRLVFLDGMARKQIDGLRKYACRLIEGGDLETLYHTFSRLTRNRIDQDLEAELYDIARERHGEIIDLFRQVCAWERRTRLVTALRSRISDPQERFLLALLMLMPDRAAIFEVVRLEYPEAEPLAMIETWIESIARKETIGFEYNAVNQVLFRGLVEGLDAEHLSQRLSGELADSIDWRHDELEDHIRPLASSDLFFPLLSESPFRQWSREA